MNKIGVLIAIRQNEELLEKFQNLKNNGFSCCQINIWDPTLYSDALAAQLRNASSATGIEISTLWAGWTGPKEWNFYNGPSTLGLVPSAHRAYRTEELLQAVEFAAKLGVPRLATHVGFLPEDMHRPDYIGTIEALRRIVEKCRAHDICFLFETGQETPVTLLRAIEDLGGDHVGVNFDTANLLLYGKANTRDALRVFGKYVMDTHIKDGFYPTDGQHLGHEVKVGDGLADIPAVMRALHELGYTGSYIIERELSGNDAQKTADILATRVYLETILKEIEENG